MILNKKGQIVEYIRKNKKVRTKELFRKFGYDGYTITIIKTLKMDKIIQEKPFECGTCKYWVIKK